MDRYDADLLEMLRISEVDTAGETRLPRRRLGRGTLALLILLRVYVIVAIPLVAYAFIRAL